MGLLQQTQAQSCVHLWSTLHLLQAVSAQPTPVLSLGVSPGPQVSAPSPLRPLADMCPWLGIAARWSGPLVPISLCSACGRLVTALCSESLKLSFHPGGHFSQWKGFPGWRNLSSFTGPSWGPRACPNFFFSSYPNSWWSFLQLFCMRAVSFQKVFCENYSTCRCIFDVFMGGICVYLFHRLDRWYNFCLHFFSSKLCFS